MAEPIIFTVTEAGKQAALNAQADSAQLKINLTQVAVGTSGYAVTGDETALTAESKRGSIVSGDVEVNSNTLRFTSSMTADAITDIYEVGLMTDDDVLFALASSTTDPLFSLHPSITFVIGFGLSLQDVADDSITVSTDPNGTLAVVIMEQHLSAPDPHPQYLGATHITDADPHAQYLNASRFQLLLQTLIPFGYQHNTHIPVNPKPLFDELMGIDTQWRRLTGVIKLATDPGDPDIVDHSIVLGQKGVTDLVNNQRPHVYPLQTTHVFERYDPATIIETVWRVVSNKSSLDEGSSVTFTVSANNLPDGQILDWSVKEGALNSASNDITDPDKSEASTVILKNGQAVIKFITTPNDNEDEAQKYVRLTVGAPANLSINVPINDLGKVETVMRITQSTTNGIELDEYFKTQSGAYPQSTDKLVRFIVDEGVDIIGVSASLPAMSEGDNWPTNIPIIIENRGRILGRGGNAGLAATLNYETDFTDLSQVETTQAEVGGTGGTAIKGNMTVDNYGLIAGGGGGGGGAGLFISGVGNINGKDTGDGNSYGAGHSGGGGGGAPLGRRYPNPHSYEEYLEFFPADDKYLLPPLNNPTTGRTYDLYSELYIRQPTDPNKKSSLRAETINPPSGTLKSEIISLDGFRHPNPDFQSNFYIPYYLDSNKIAFKLWSWTGDRAFVDIGMRQSTNATTEQKGLGGIGLSQLGSVSGIKRIAEIPSFDITKNKGGDGGAIGEAGQAAVLGQFYVSEYDGYVETTAKSITKSQTRLVIEPKTGGLAGFAIEGDVTVTNFESGLIKGR